MIKQFARFADLIGTIGLTVYTLSLFTLFTAVQTNNRTQDLIHKYQLAVDTEKTAVGDYLAQIAVEKILDDVSKKNALAQLLQELANLHQQFAELRALSPRLELSRDLSDWNVSREIKERLRNQLPDPSGVDSDLLIPVDARPLTARQYREYTSQVLDNTVSAQNRTDALNMTLKTGLSTLLGATGLDEYVSSALADLSEAFYEKYFAPLLEKWGIEGPLLLDHVEGIHSELEKSASEALGRNLNKMLAFRFIPANLNKAISVLQELPPEKREAWIREHFPNVSIPNPLDPSHPDEPRPPSPKPVI